MTTGVDLPSLVGRWFTVGDVLLFGMKRCPPCTHLERLTGVRLVKAMVHRGGINAAVFAGGRVAEGPSSARCRRPRPPAAGRPRETTGRFRASSEAGPDQRRGGIQPVE